MATIKELVAQFTANEHYSDWDHEIAQKWLDATRCGDADVRLLANPRSSLRDGDSKLRDTIKGDTLEFIRHYFDDRPDVARSLDALFAELGLSDDHGRRGEFFAFDKLYSRDEAIVLLLKHLQPMTGRGRYTQEDIAEYFLTTDRTIRDYIAALRPWNDPDLSAKVFGQIVQMDPARGTNVPESTTHPLFLPLNMVELYILVDMLVGHVNDTIEGPIVASILKRILDQTTPYSRERLSRVEGFDKALFSIELLGEQQGPGEAVLYSEKEGVQATVRYEEDEAEKTYSGYIWRIRKNKKNIDVDGDEGVRHIPYKNIVELKPLQK